MDISVGRSNHKARPGRKYPPDFAETYKCDEKEFVINRLYRVRSNALMFRSVADHPYFHHFPKHFKKVRFVDRMKVPQRRIERWFVHISKHSSGCSMTEHEQRELAEKEATRDWVGLYMKFFIAAVKSAYAEVIAIFHEKVSEEGGYIYTKGRFPQYQDRFPEFNYGFPGVSSEFSLKTGKPATGKLYVEECIEWLWQEVHNEDIFPVDSNSSFPKHFLEHHVVDMATVLFRIFGFIYNVCWPVLVASQNRQKFNTCFKCFYLFSRRFNLFDVDTEKYLFETDDARVIMSIENLEEKHIELLSREPTPSESHTEESTI